ncbi:MAG TPA: hypothetical protein VMZ31_17710 [Phycisphaerae bacterium]|nr:hypothetical protein [Phycisphaerae bacterium]
MSEPALKHAEPALVLSHNFTYYAPVEVFGLPLTYPQAVAFGSALTGPSEMAWPVTYLHMSRNVQDRLELNAQHIITKRVRVAQLHGVLLYDGQTLRYRHLGHEPSVIAEPRRDSIIVTDAGGTVDLTLGQTVGFGMTTDGFGEIMWWYYFRIHSLAALRQQSRSARSHG